MRLRPFILCFYRTAFLIQKSSLKSSAFRPNPFPRILSKSCRHAAVPNRFLAHFSTSRTNGPRSLSQMKAGTHSPFGERSHTAAHTPKHGRFGWGVVSLPSERSTRSPTSPGRVSERQVLPLLGLGRGCSQRTQKAFGTAMRLCASLFRGVAAPLGCVIFFAFVEIGICTSGAHGFPRVRGVGGITTLGALCVLLKYRTVACQSGSFAIFRGQVGVVPPHDSYFLANTQNFLLAVPVANTFALWYDKFDKLEVVSSFIFIFF